MKNIYTHVASSRRTYLVALLSAREEDGNPVSIHRQRLKSQLMQQQVDLTHNVVIRRRQAIPRLAYARQRSVSTDVSPSFTVDQELEVVTALPTGVPIWCAALFPPDCR